MLNLATLHVVAMADRHADEVLDIYRSGIEEGNATFEMAPPDWDTFVSKRIHRYVAVDGDRVLGWVACTPVSDRDVYAGVVEHSVYVRPDARGRGVGRLLLNHLIDVTERDGIWTIQAGVFPENAASLALHESSGFRVIGVRERIGRRQGVWRDVALLERRSSKI
jgi:phosphinothricin acetyltransferase